MKQGSRENQRLIGFLSCHKGSSDGRKRFALRKDSWMPEDEVEVKNPNVASLREALDQLGLSSKGHAKELKDRLRKAKRKATTASAEAEADGETDAAKAVSADQEDQEAQAAPQQPFEWYCVFDVEATCREDNRGWNHEIIEFPVVLLSGRTRETIAEFRSYVRPVLNPVLTEFCTALTGITQEQVDAAPLFPEVLKLFDAFLSRHQVKHARMRFITDGPWDIRDFVTKQCNLCNIRKPAYLNAYIDLRRTFAKHYGRREGKRANLAGMLSLLGMEFEGREHCGMDDARNIARIAVRLMERGVVFGETVVK